MQAEMMLEILIVCIVFLASMVSAHKLLNSCNVDFQNKACGTEDDQPSEELEAAEECDDGFDQFSDEEEIDIDTFVMPPRPDCSICTLPLPFEETDQVTVKPCCGYILCSA